MASFSGWRVELLRAIGAPVTRSNMKLLWAWQRAEGGSARFNPLNTTQSAPGATNYNSVGVKNYRSAKQGARATAHTLLNGYYKDVVSLLRRAKNPVHIAQAVGNSPWGTSGQTIEQLLGHAPESAAPTTSRARGRGSLVQYARKFLGIPYKWGGTTPAGFDCSGFVQYLYAHFGVHLPRTTYDQVKVGKAVSRGELKVGDILFFEPGKSGPGHEGMYIGNGKVIEAPHTGANVQIISFAKMAKSDTFVAARRIGGIQNYVKAAVRADVPASSSVPDAMQNFTRHTNIPAPTDMNVPLPAGFQALPGQAAGFTPAPGTGAQASQVIGQAMPAIDASQNWAMLAAQPGSSLETQSFAQRATLYPLGRATLAGPQ